MHVWQQGHQHYRYCRTANVMATVRIYTVIFDSENMKYQQFMAKKNFSDLLTG